MLDIDSIQSLGDDCKRGSLFGPYLQCLVVPLSDIMDSNQDSGVKVVAAQIRLLSMSYLITLSAIHSLHSPLFALDHKLPDQVFRAICVVQFNGHVCIGDVGNRLVLAAIFVSREVKGKHKKQRRIGRNTKKADIYSKVRQIGKLLDEP